MRVLIPLDKDFEYERCRKMYDYYSNRVLDDSTFDEIIKNTLFYSFYDDDLLTLCLYFYSLNNKLWVNGFGIRKKHLFNSECFKKSLSWFNTDIWVWTKYREVAWAILKCGFQKVDTNLYVYKQCNYERK